MFNIFISPGHNEFTYKSGSKMVKVNNEIFREFNDFNIKVANKLSVLLKKHNEFKVHQLEYDNNKIDMELSERIKYINKNCTMNDIVISIHANYSDNQSAGGVWLLYSGVKSKKLTELYIKHSKGNLIPYSKTYECTTKEKWLNLGIVLRTNCPAILLEVGFFSNAFDRKQLSSDKYQNQVATSLYDMVLDYYGINKYVIEKCNVKTEQWKLDEVEKAVMYGYIDNDSWKNKVDESIPVWAVLSMLNDICKKIDSK